MAAWHPEVTVAAIAERDGRFLVVEEQVGGRLVYNQPAGHLEDNETLLQAVVRETMEETAWEVEPVAVAGIYLFRSPRRKTSILRSCFIVRALRHHPGADLDEGIVRACWLSRDELANSGRLRSPFVLRCIDDYLAGQQHPLQLIASLNVPQV